MYKFIKMKNFIFQLIVTITLENKFFIYEDTADGTHYLKKCALWFYTLLMIWFILNLPGHKKLVEGT